MKYANETNKSPKYQIALCKKRLNKDFCKKKDNKNNDNNNNNNSNESQGERGHVTGGFHAERDNQGNFYIEGGVEVEAQINDNTSVGVSGSGWVDQNGNYGGGVGGSLTIGF